jgi:hypothetical protein
MPGLSCYTAATGGHGRVARDPRVKYGVQSMKLSAIFELHQGPIVWRAVVGRTLAASGIRRLMDLREEVCD